MIVTGSIIGGISFGIQAYNSWSNETNAKKIQDAQESFQRAALMQNLDEATRLFDMMTSTKREIMQEERESQRNLMRELHRENLRSIEYLASLDRWPLAVMPLVMRDDHLFFEPKDNAIVPINVILGPCRDRNFQTQIWKLVEDELAIRFSTYWSVTSSHPIVFYQDAWKDDRDQADSTMCANIHAKIPQTPTVILSPVITRCGLQIEVTRWCVDGIDDKQSYKEIRLSLSDNCHQYTKEEAYDVSQITSYITELADLIESIIGYLDDQYMWLRYHLLPQFPLILQNRINIDNEEGRQLVYHEYVEMLSSSLSNGHINVIADLKLVLEYCSLIDQFGHGHKAFDVVCRFFYGDNLLADLRNNTPAYKTESLICFLDFCIKNMTGLDLAPETIQDMRYGVSLAKLNEGSQMRYFEDERRTSSPQAKQFILTRNLLKDACDNFKNSAESAFMEILCRCKEKTTASVDRRNWCRPQYTEKLKSIFAGVTEELLSEIDQRSHHYLEQIALDSMQITWASQQGDEMLGKSLSNGEVMPIKDEHQLIASVQDTIKRYALDKAIIGNHEYWQKTYMNGSINSKLQAYCNAVLVGWIDYHLWGEDLFQEEPSEKAKREIGLAMKAITDLIKALASNYIDTLFVNLNNKE